MIVASTTMRGEPIWTAIGDDRPLSAEAIRALAGLLLDAIERETEEAGGSFK